MARLVPGILAHPDVLDKFMIWYMDGPRYRRQHLGAAKCETMRRKGIMQKQWTIEARADFADQEKNEAITRTVQRAAALVSATISLLSDGVKPQVVAFCDDWFGNHEDIDLLAKSLGEDTPTELGKQEDVSDDLLQAIKDMGVK